MTETEYLGGNQIQVSVLVTQSREPVWERKMIFQRRQSPHKMKYRRLNNDQEIVIKISVRTVSEKLSVKLNSSFRAAWMNNCNSRNRLTEPRMPTKVDR